MASYLVIVAGVLATFLFKIGRDVYWPQWWFLVLMVLVYFGFQMKRAPISMRLFFIYATVTDSIYAFYRPLTEHLPLQGLFAMRYVTLQAMTWLVIPAILINYWPQIRRPMLTALFAGGLLHAASLIYDQVVLQIPTGEATIGLLGNRSIGATFTSIWVFFCAEIAREMERPNRWLNVMAAAWFGVIAIMVSNSSISFAALCAGAYAAYWATDDSWAQRLRVLGFSIPVAAVVGYFAAPRMFGTNARYGAWEVFWTFWRDHFNIWFGSGGGTFLTYGPMAQQDYKFMLDHFFLWAHSDWFQILLEYGIIGAVLSVWIYFEALRKSYSRPILFGALVSIGVNMIGNYPMENAACALMMVWIFAEAIDGTDS